MENAHGLHDALVATRTDSVTAHEHRASDLTAVLATRLALACWLVFRAAVFQLFDTNQTKQHDDLLTSGRCPDLPCIKGFIETKMRRSTRQQPKRNSGRGPADKPDVNRSSIAVHSPSRFT